MVSAMTGHRPPKLGGYDPMNPTRRALKAAVRAFYIRAGIRKAIIGMALGFDQDAAWVAHSLGLPFVAAVPFEGQELAWPNQAQAEYRELLKLAHEVVIVSPGGYAAWKMQKRNEWMADRAAEAQGWLGAGWDGSDGGTANCVRYAERLPGLRIHNVWDEAMDLLLQERSGGTRNL